MSNIVQFNPDTERSVTVVSVRTCAHRNGCTVDRATRQVACARCGATLDPVEWLCGWAEQNAQRKREEKAAENFWGVAYGLARDFEVKTELRGGGVTCVYKDRFGARRTRTVNAFGCLERSLDMMHQLRDELEFAARKAG